MPGLLKDETKIRISREILSGGPGYKAFRSGGRWSNGKDVTKRHMGRFVRTVYVPTSPEWEPPAYLMDKWWELVNEEGNTVGLKALIPAPEDRHIYEDPRREEWVNAHIQAVHAAFQRPVRFPWDWVRRLWR